MVYNCGVSTSLGALGFRHLPEAAYGNSHHVLFARIEVRSILSCPYLLSWFTLPDRLPV